MKEMKHPKLKRRIALTLALFAFVLPLLCYLSALSLSPLLSENRALFFLLFSLLLILLFVLAAGAALPLTRWLIRPFQTAVLQKEISEDTYEELVPLLSRLENQDATIEKQLRAADRRKEEFRVLSENMDEGLVVADRHGKIISANLVARAFMEEFSVGENAVNEILEIARGGRHTERQQTQNGKHYRLIGSPVLQNERIFGAVVLLLDETERRNMEQYRKEFTANVSHELKTPLTSICGFAELLKNGMVATKDIPEFAEDIYNEARRLLTLVNDIIRLSRLEDGSKPYENTDVDLYTCAAQALSAVQPAANALGITTSLEGTRETFSGAEPIFYDILYNLCDNAVKYNRPGGWVKVYVGEGETGILLSVEDNGIGIPAEHIDRVFERFYRVDKSHSKEIGGTGLGLSIVRHGVAYHGGELSLRSTQGEGTRVTIILKKQQTTN